MSDPQAPPTRGLVAGKYEILGLIGRGGMGSVWEGRHASLGTRVAIKFIEQEYIDSEEARARFATEARAAATIRSRHAIQIFDHGLTEEGSPYIVMELLSGESLDKRLDRVGRISLPDTARIIGHVARALQRAHDAGIIHRDLKPENIFLVRTLDDDDEIAKVLDFGIAKIKPSAGGSLSSSTKTGAVLGTPYFMSPEQARGLRTIDHRSDLWSLGVIAYKCVAGALPFEGESVGDLLVKICTSAPPVPSAVVPGLPKTFDAWFFHALERDPEQRFSTATELGEALAYAAGFSARHAPADVASADDLARRAAFAQTSPMAIAGITSAPFTAPVRHSAQKRNIWLAIAGATLVGGSIGVVSVVKLMGPTPAAASGVVSTPDPSTDPKPHASLPPPPAPTPEPSQSAPPLPALSKTVLAVPKAPARAVAPAAPPAKLPPPKPAPPTANGGNADPGY